jgi:16S rRNA (adenine1518-N6/adenine1519-N6)-dimethyltransferase
VLSRNRAIELLEAAGVAPRRSRGQNFVVDPNTVRRIARLAEVGPGDRVLEIGPGLGSLTLALAETGAQILAVDVDAALVDILRCELASLSESDPDLAARIDLRSGDARTVPWNDWLEGGEPWHLVANLPYNIATPLVADLLDTVPAITTMLVMVQAEVAERLAAAVGDEAYGAVSVKVASWASARIVGRVPPTVFHPRPRVDSALVRLVRHQEPAIPSDIDREQLFTLVRAGFGQRRKMLRRSLAAHVSPDMFERAGIAPTARAEELDLTAWVRLTRSVFA